MKMIRILPHPLASKQKRHCIFISAKRTMVLILIVFLFGFIHSMSVKNGTNLENLESRMEKLENLVSSIESSLTNISGAVNKVIPKPVLFFAIIKSKGFNLNTESTVIFETVIINEGGHYNHYDGVFVAPQDGIYMFSWTVSSVNANYVITELVVEDSVISSTGEKGVDSGDFTSASMTVLCRMKKDDHAWIRTTGYSSPHYFNSHDNYPRTSFMGLLV